MPGFLERLQGAIQSGAQQFREKTYPEMRNAMARTALDLGGASTSKEGKAILHGQGNYNLTKKLYEAGLPAQFAANVADLGYLGNETFTGALAKLAGRPFFSDYGFRWGDVAINRGGQDRALEDIAKQQAAEEPSRRGWRGIRTASQ